MKIYSDVLTGQQITAAARATPGLGFENFGLRDRPRLATGGWDILLHRAGSRHPFNSGRHGAGGQGAASWADYGHFLAALYELDPAMQVRGSGAYKNRDDFHRKTGGQFRPATAARS